MGILLIRRRNKIYGIPSAFSRQKRRKARNLHLSKFQSSTYNRLREILNMNGHWKCDWVGGNNSQLKFWRKLSTISIKKLNPIKAQPTAFNSISSWLHMTYRIVWQTNISIATYSILFKPFLYFFKKTCLTNSPNIFHVCFLCEAAMLTSVTNHEFVNSKSKTLISSPVEP